MIACFCTFGSVPYSVVLYIVLASKSWICLSVFMSSLITVSRASVNVTWLDRFNKDFILEKLRRSFDVLNATVCWKFSACGSPVDGTLDELDHRRDHFV